MREEEEEGGRAQRRVVEISREGCEEAFGGAGGLDGERKQCVGRSDGVVR